MKKWMMLSLVLAVCLTGCAKTPEAPVVVQKNQERLMEKAVSEDEERKSLQEAQEESPSDYSFYYQSGDGKVTISAEADVVLPETEQIPMYYVSCQGFPQEQVTALYDFFFQGENTWNDPSNWYYTKAMADEDMEEARRELERLRADTEMDSERRAGAIDHWQSLLEGLQEMYDTIPDTITKAAVDSTYQIETYDSINGPGEYQRLDARSDSGKGMWVYSYSQRYASSNLTYQGPSGDKYCDDPCSNWMRNDPVPYGAEVPFSCGYSYEEAKALADSVFQAAGVEVRLIQTELLRGEWNTGSRYGDISYEQDDVYNAYRFCYSRVVDGIPVAATTSNVMYLEDNNPAWMYERMYVVVDSGGISNLYWGFPVTCGEKLSDDVEVLPFEKAARVFEEMAPLIYQGKIAELEEESRVSRYTSLNVDRVELNLMRTRDGGGVTGLYVPTWVFYGREEQGVTDAPESHVEQTPWIILAVNAVDGSIIDVKAGY